MAGLAFDTATGQKCKTDRTTPSDLPLCSDLTVRDNPTATINTAAQDMPHRVQTWQEPSTRMIRPMSSCTATKWFNPATGRIEDVPKTAQPLPPCKTIFNPVEYYPTTN